MESSQKPLISIVTPCYNEALNVEEQFRRVKEALVPFSGRYEFEFIFTDNVSTDRTFEILQSLVAQDPRVRILRFSRNIGANRAIYQGLIHAQGEAAVLIQADLQDPPELIPEFIKGWEHGYDVVYGQIANRDESWLMKNLRKMYYKLVASLADVKPPQNAGEFRIVSRRVLDAIRLYREDDIYLRGVIAHIGYRQKPIPYERAARQKGESSTNFLFLLSYGLNGLVSTSVAPLRLVIVVGILTALSSFAFALYHVVYKLLFPEYIPQGLTALITIILFLAGVQLFALGILGEYLRKIYVQSLQRPQALIADKVNFHSRGEAS